MSSDLLFNSFEDYRHRIDSALSSLVTSREPVYLYDPINYVLKGKGKRLRPILVITVAQLFDVSLEKAMPAALAVELLHNFSLVHDDIMDNDETRHGYPTVHTKWDESTAILAGDGIFALVYDQLTKSDSNLLESINAVNDATIKLCEGQALDKDFELRQNVTVLEYLTMVALKTGAMLSLCCQLGAILGAADEKVQCNLKEFGVLIGQSFQIQDDVLEIFSNSEDMGKSLGSDVFAGKKTYLICKAHEQDSDGWNKFMNSLKNKDLHSEVLPALRNYFKENGILQKANSEIYAIMALAKLKLDIFDDEKKSGLIKLVDIITTRKK